MRKTDIILLALAILAGVLLWGCDSGGGEEAVCGDGLVGKGEACDLENLGGATCVSLGFSGGELACSAACGLDTGRCWTCGNGALEPGEPCDGTLGNVPCSSVGFVLGITSCRDDCTLDTGGCQLPLFCGNGQLDPGEPCDPTAPGGGVPAGLTCELGWLGPGTVVCDDNCRPDFIGCAPPAPTCGNGVVDGGEQCEGRDLRGRTCADLFYFGDGALACYPGCTYDASACSPVHAGTTSGSPCEVGLPCFPADDRLPRRCVSPSGDPADARCEPACERHADCPLGLSCLEAGGLKYCAQEYCAEFGGTCTPESGLPGRCEGVVCVMAGARQFGQVCVIPEEVVVWTGFPVFNFQYDPLWFCADAGCVPDDDPAGPYGTCGPPACDAAAVVAGEAPDPCPPLFNCVDTAEVRLTSLAPGFPALWDLGGQCRPMTDAIADPHGPTLACHVLTGRMTYRDVACPGGMGCAPTTDPGFRYPGSLQGECVTLPATPLAEGAPCSDDTRCGEGAACVIADPFTAAGDLAAPRACRRACDAAVYEDNPACAGLPGDADRVCLSISRFFTPDNGLTWTNPDDPQDVRTVTPSPLGFCVPAPL